MNGYIELIHEFDNLGPIQDMICVDLQRQGQSQIVCCSGIGSDGSLRIIKNGIGIDEVACIDMPGLEGLWSLTETNNSIYHKYLIASFVSETRILYTDDEGLDEIEMTGLLSNKRTIFTCNTVYDTFIQIIDNEIRLISLDESSKYPLISKWETNVKITHSICNGKQILCSLSGGNLILFEIIKDSNNNIIIHEKLKTKLEFEISCLNLSIKNNHNISEYCCVGLWKEKSVRILSLNNNFSLLYKFNLNSDNIARSVVITNFDVNTFRKSDNDTIEPKNDDLYIFVGMGDGSLIEGKLNINNNNISITQFKQLPLGTQPVKLTPFVCNNIVYIFGGCDRPSVIYKANNRMFYANVNLPEINFMSEFNASDYTDCLAMSVNEQLMIGSMDDVQKLHITKIKLNEQPRRIAYNKQRGCYLVATKTFSKFPHTITNENENKDNNIINNPNIYHPKYHQTIFKLHLIDDITFESIFSKELPPYLNITKIISHTFKCDPHVTYFIILYAKALPHENDANEGKIDIAMVVDNKSDKKLKIVSSKKFKNAGPYCVRALGDDYLLVGIKSKIQLFKWKLKSSNNVNIGSNNNDEYLFGLEHLHTIYGFTYILDIKVHGDFFIGIDLMKSISMYVYTKHHSSIKTDTDMKDNNTESKDNNTNNNSTQNVGTITEIARDYEPAWMKCGELYNDQYIIGVDASGNLFGLKRNIESTNEDERGRLDKVSKINLCDDVNCIVKGSLVMDIPVDYKNTNNIYNNETKTNDNNNKIYDIKPLRPRDIQKCIFGTIDGSIGAVLSLPYHRYSILQKIEKTMIKFIQGIGGLKHENFRAFNDYKSTSKSAGFLDGDLIESFLELSDTQQNTIANDMKMDLDVLIKIIEEMNRLH